MTTLSGPFLVSRTGGGTRNPTSGPALGPLPQKATPFDTAGLLQPSRPAHLACSLVGIADPSCGLTRPARAFGRDGPILGKRTPETQQAGLLTGRCHKTPRLLTPLVSCRNLGPLTLPGPPQESLPPLVTLPGMRERLEETARTPASGHPEPNKQTRPRVVATQRHDF